MSVTGATTLPDLVSKSHRKIWNRSEAAKISALFPGQRYELIEGDLIDKMGQKPPHANIIMLLTRLLAEAFPGRVRIQLPITLPDPEGVWSEPEPDVVLVNGDLAEFSDRHPGPAEVALLIEVSDSSLGMDRDIKGKLYARCGIQAYWIVDIPRRRVMVFQEPAIDEYKTTRIYEAHEEVHLPQGPVMKIASLFGRS